MMLTLKSQPTERAPMNVPVTKMPKIKPLTTTALKMMLASGAISGRP